jgi:hypothetical protein
MTISWYLMKNKSLLGATHVEETLAWLHPLLDAFSWTGNPSVGVASPSGDKCIRNSQFSILNSQLIPGQLP